MTGARLVRLALLVGLGGLLLTGVGLLVDVRRALASYLTAWAAVLLVVVGALTLRLAGHLSGARIFRVMRQPGDVVTYALPGLVLLFLPVLIGAPSLYPWTGPAVAAPDFGPEPYRGVETYFDLPFWIARAALYFAAWLALLFVVRRRPLPRDVGAERRPAEPNWVLRVGGVLLLTLTVSFAAIDWLMSLAPWWHSSVFGLYALAGGITGAVALVALLQGPWLAPRERTDVDARDHDAVATALLLAVLLWAYTAFQQYLLIWIGNLPAEVSWYVPRRNSSWRVLGLLLVVGYAALPVAALVVALLTGAARRPRVLGAIGGWVLLMHYLDVYWIVIPTVHPDGLRPHWLDLTALAAVLGLAIALAGWRARRARPAVDQSTSRNAASAA